MSKDIGDKLGPRLAALIGKYTTAARRDHAPIEARIRQVATQALIDRAGLEVGEHHAAVIQQLLDAHPGMSDWLQKYLSDTASGRHQWKALSGVVGLTGISGGLNTVMTNELAHAVQIVVELNPNIHVDQNTAAQAAAAGITSYDESAVFAAQAGFDGGQFAILHALAQSIPGADQLLDMFNRGTVSQAELDGWLIRTGLPVNLLGAVRGLARTELSPADAALAVLRTTKTQAEGEAIAARSGVTAADFQTLIDNTGEPLGLEQLLEARRRGFIDDARLVKGILESRVRNEWVDVAERLAYSPMSIADAVNAVVQGYFTPAQAGDIANQNGLEPGQITTLIETAGEPLSRTELEQLFNRGEISQAEVEQGLRESRIKNKYVPDALKLHVRLPEGRQVVSMITHSAISKDAGTKILLELGYSPEIAAALIAEGTNTKLGAHKDLSISEIRTLYVDGIFSHGQAVQYLAALGYDTAESDFLIKSWDLLAGAAITRQAVGAIRGRFVARDLNEQQVNLELDSLGIPATAKQNYVRIWTIERDSRLSVLTEAQIVAAHKKQLITGDDAFNRLTGRGYSAGDAKILLGVSPDAAVPA